MPTTIIPTRNFRFLPLRLLKFRSEENNKVVTSRGRICIFIIMTQFTIILSIIIIITTSCGIVLYKS